jgi:hypothetical protein
VVIAAAWHSKTLPMKPTDYEECTTINPTFDRVEDDIARLLEGAVEHDPGRGFLMRRASTRLRSSTRRSNAHRTIRRVVFDPTTSMATPRR